MYVHVYTAKVSPPRLNERLARQIESVIKSAGRRVCDLLSQQKLDDAMAELEVRLYNSMAMDTCTVNNKRLTFSLSFCIIVSVCCSNVLNPILT